MSHASSDRGLPLGACRLDQSRGLLFRDGEVVPLRPKAFALLCHLAANTDRVVSKSDLMEAVWPRVLVTEDSLTQAVRELRKALGDECQQTIRTIAKRGYLLSLTDAQADVSNEQPTVAVLRFINEGSTADAPLVDGFTEDLVNGLARFRIVSVLARNSSFAFSSDNDCDWQDIGRQLNADFLVRGRMLVSDRIEANIALVDAKKGLILWSDRLGASGAGIFDIQNEIALKIVNRLVTRLNDANMNRTAARPTTNLAAYEMILRGLTHFRSYRPEDNFKAKACFEAAIEKDPDYALAHSYVALVDLAIGGYGEAPADVIAACVDRSDHAVSLAPEEPRCHRVLALTRLHAREHGAAEHHLRRSLELNPYDADTMTQMGYLLTMRGKPVEALEWIDKAVRINPIHPDWYHYDRSMALYSVGNYAEAIESLSRLSTKTPWRMTRQAAAYAQLGNSEQAHALMAEIQRTAPGYSPMDFAKHGVVFEHQADIDHLAEGVAKALTALPR